MLSLVLTITIQNISTKIDRKQPIPLPLLIVEMTLTCLICVFEAVIGVMTTMILKDTGLRVKWPFYLTVWVILVSYIVLQLFEAFLYVNSTYHTIDPKFNQLRDRLIAGYFHYSLIYVAMFVIVWHTNRINAHTLKMLEQQANKKANRRTHNFGKMQRPELEGGLVIQIQNLGSDDKGTALNSSTTVFEPNSGGLPKSIRTQDDGPSEPMIIARKGNQFRTVISKKLGMDIEHEIEEYDSDSDMSAQTDELIDGYEEACNSPRSHSRVEYDEFGKREGSVFQDEYKLLSSKSF